MAYEGIPGPGEKFKGFNLAGPETSGQHSAFGDVGRFLFGGMSPEQQAYGEYNKNLQATPIEGREQYAGRYAQEATKAARPGLMAAGQKARGQAASYLARQGAPTGRTAATQAQISNSLAQSMAAMQASAMAAGMQAHEGYRQNEQARRDAAMSQLAGMQGQQGLIPAGLSYLAGRGIDALTGGMGGQGIGNGLYPGDTRRLGEGVFDEDLDWLSRYG